MLPEHYGQSHHVIRKGNLTYGTLQDELSKVSSIISGYEDNVKKAEQTQNMYQFLAVTGTVVMLLGGMFIGYKFYQEVQSNKPKSSKK